MSGHERFEELSALAALGELSAPELLELKEHLAECEECQQSAAEFTHIVHSEFPVLHEDRESFWNRLERVIAPERYKGRFLLRARAQGFSFSEEIHRKQVQPSGFRLEHALIATLLVVAIGASIIAVRSKRLYEKALAGHQDYQQIRTSDTDRQSLKVRLDLQARLIAELRTDLAAARTQLDMALVRASRAEREQEIGSTDAQRLRAALDAETLKNAELGSRLNATYRQTAALNDEVQRLNALKGAGDLQIASQQTRLDELSQELEAQRRVLASERQLLAAGRDIRDLMGARNLHIIDVFDTDLKGKNKKAFGRVFYTEGKSLIFYAFDLGNKKVVDAKSSFQAWGVRDGAGGQVKSLGIFFADDKTQKRWVLKVQDPAVLEQIDSVFVTAEPFGGAKQPTGQKLLYAYLKNQANHP